MGLRKLENKIKDERKVNKTSIVSPRSQAKSGYVPTLKKKLFWRPLNENKYQNQERNFIIQKKMFNWDATKAILPIN